MSNITNCIKCKYAVIDKDASKYSKKHCKTCGLNGDCVICQGCEKSDSCNEKKHFKQICNERIDTVCPMQKEFWIAYQCGNCDSQYHCCLLNVGCNGEKFNYISWLGCEEGVPK